MLNEEAFEGWCLQQHLSEQAKTVVQRIRSSPPSRLVRGAAGNVSGRYRSCENGVQHAIREPSRGTRLHLPNGA